MTPMPNGGHYSFAEFDAAWSSVLKPWFEAWRELAWRQEKPVVVTCPQGALVSALKQRLATEGIPTFGIHFTSPGTLRRLLKKASGLEINLARREDLHLLARIAAAGDPSRPLWQSVAADPAPFIRAFDALEGGGWGPEALLEPAARALAQAMVSLLKASGLSTIRQVDQHLAQGDPTPLISSWLAFGFSSADWPEYRLLAATFARAETATLCFLTENERLASASWTGTWEEIAGPIQYYLDAENEQPYAPVAEAFTGHQTHDAHLIRFHNVQTLESEVTAIYREITQCLNREPVPRIAVVLPRRFTLLGREIALKLAEASIPHHDQAGHRPAQSPTQGVFHRWLAFQRTQRLSTFLEFTEALTALHPQWQKPVKAARHRLSKAFQTVQTEQIPVLSAWVGEPLEALFTWPLLPPEGTLAQYLEHISPQLTSIQWPKDLKALLEQGEHLAKGLGQETVARNTFLQWLGDVADIPGRSRAEVGRQPFAPIQILTLDEAAGQSWDFIILAGMHHGDWPPEVPESAYLRESHSRALNQRTFQTGSQGEGQAIVAPEHALIPTALDETVRHEALLATLLASAREQVITTVSLREPTEPTTRRGASEWLIRLIAADRGLWPDTNQLEAWATASETAFQEQRAPNESTSFPEIRRAHQNRFAPETPFDRFSFCFETPLDHDPILTASQWEGIFKYPASIGYQAVLNVHPRESFAHDESAPSLIRGIWVHAWLNPTQSGEWRLKPTTQVWLQQVEQRAQDLRAKVTHAYASANRALPDWWLNDWAIARHMARELTTALTSGETLPYLSGEYRLPESKLPLVPNIFEIPLRGRIDLLLADQPGDPGAGQRYQIIDYKTGSHPILSLKRLAQGAGLQAALYALAIHALGAPRVSTTLLKPGDAFAEQLTDAEAQTLSDLWGELAAIEQQGKLGDLSNANPNYGYAPQRPLADLKVPKPILNAKWKRTHPQATPEKPS